MFLVHFDYSNDKFHTTIACSNKTFPTNKNYCPASCFYPNPAAVTCEDCKKTEEFKKALLDFELKFDGDIDVWEEAFFFEK